MFDHILGVGNGLVILGSLWTIILLLCLASIHIQSNVGTIGAIVGVIVTLILILVPQHPAESKSSITDKEYDHLFIWRICIVGITGISAIVAGLAVLILDLFVPIQAKYIKNEIR